MKKIAVIGLLIMVPALMVAQVHDTLVFQGQLSAWANLSTGADLPLWMGGRYLPQIGYQVNPNGKHRFDLEGALNINGFAGVEPFDAWNPEGSVKPYRIWGRYSTNQFEARIGLQKINFGSATMLRPLMWFDKLDPRDPLQFTDGVWGALIRYYWISNANVWIWGLQGNQDPKPWEIGQTNQQMPELGGRYQHPVPGGEAALTYHYRMADTRNTGLPLTGPSDVPEHRFGFDGKWDIGPGVWLEGTWISKAKEFGAYTNQMMFTAGTDYTFALGSGLNVSYEYMLLGFNRNPFTFHDPWHLSALSVSYAPGLFDNLSAILFIDHQQNNLYSFLHWKHQMNNIALYLMAYRNPETYMLPQMDGGGTLFSGKGVQIMLAFNL